MITQRSELEHPSLALAWASDSFEENRLAVGQWLWVKTKDTVLGMIN